MRARLCALVGCAVFVSAGFAVVAPDAVAAESISATITPSAPEVDDTLVVHATVSGAVAQPASLTVVRTDRNGQQLPFMAMPTGTTGDYSGTDPLPAVWGKVTYHVADIDNATHMTNATGQASTYVRRHVPVLTIKRQHGVVSAGRLARVTAHLGKTDTNRRVRIYAHPYDRDRTRIAAGNVDATSGNLSATYTMARRTRFAVRFGGDAKYRPASTYVVVLARAVMHEHLRGGYATSGSYRLYHESANPVLAAHLLPELDGVCLRFRAERYFDGGWHLVAVGCVRTDSDGRAIGVLDGDHHLNSPYRVRARWPGSFALLAKSGTWQKLKFRP
jgi:hypothetical protein